MVKHHYGFPNTVTVMLCALLACSCNPLKDQQTMHLSTPYGSGDVFGSPEQLRRCLNGDDREAYRGQYCVDFAGQPGNTGPGLVQQGPVVLYYSRIACMKYRTEDACKDFARVVKDYAKQVGKSVPAALVTDTLKTAHELCERDGNIQSHDRGGMDRTDMLCGRYI